METSRLKVKIKEILVKIREGRRNLVEAASELDVLWREVMDREPNWGRGKIHNIVTIEVSGIAMDGTTLASGRALDVSGTVRISESLPLHLGEAIESLEACVAEYAAPCETHLTSAAGMKLATEGLANVGVLEFGYRLGWISKTDVGILAVKQLLTGHDDDFLAELAWAEDLNQELFERTLTEVTQDWLLEGSGERETPKLWLYGLIHELLEEPIDNEQLLRARPKIEWLVSHASVSIDQSLRRLLDEPWTPADFSNVVDVLRQLVAQLETALPSP